MQKSALTLLLSLGFSQSACQSFRAVEIEGIIWQPNAEASRPSGDWQKIGAQSLLVQWVVVDGATFLPATAWPRISPETDWDRVATEPWATNVIVGLAGRFQENEARAMVDELAVQSLLIPDKIPKSINVIGWYFPVEADPSWKEVKELGAALDKLPRPLWISIYDKTNKGDAALIEWLETWLPEGVGVLFQDGVGEHVRDARTASRYARALEASLGKERVIVIAEAFRPKPGGGFRAATPAELRPQLNQYTAHRVFLFDGPHYVSPDTVRTLSSPQRRAAGK